MVKFMLITNAPDYAHIAEECGVSRIFVDLEVMGKYERQGHLDTLISQHSMSDVRKVKSKLVRAELLVRLNPVHSGTDQEIEQAIEAGADLLMLPMFHSASELQWFCEKVDGRVGVVPLVETFSAAQSIQDIVGIRGVTEIYVGLNDLHLDMNLKFMFELLANGFLEDMIDIIKSAGLPYGFGGIARVGEGVIPGEMVLGEHLRLGSSSVILSRTFHRKNDDVSGNNDLEVELGKLYSAAEQLKMRSADQVDADRQHLKAVVEEFVAGKK